MRVPTAVLPHTLLVRAYAGDTATGKTWGEPRKVRGRFKPSRKAITTSTGVTLQLAGTILVRPEVDIPPESKVTYAGTDYEVADTADGSTFSTSTPAGRILAVI